ncbi:hypothetical protein N7466_007347 [Penicillium verhagenii]|uniref:uncharacterized protein n=1 Tax=Penicillium verhagenii TaxID=1562060 RepID=UPI0025456781|nr:uncharacterized protein N7466_007347 [Penicillium verhagenii]KAJ5928391.1 hypothetical protein N7466_007347 [Penicillium verhagenii]
MQQARLSVVRPCRLIARRRFPAPSFSRRFHLSQQWRSAPSSDPHDGPSTPSDTVDNRQSSKIEDVLANQSQSPIEGDQTGKPAAKPYGSALRRAMRNRQAEQEKQKEPAAAIPSWFADQNIVTRGSEDAQQAQQVEITISKPVPTQMNAQKKEIPTGGAGDEPVPSSEPAEFVEESSYAVPEEIWGELRASVKAGLRLPPTQYAKEPAAKKSHLTLQYPGHDGIPFLDAVVRQLSNDLKTDLITLNAQDIAQLFSEQDLAETGATSPIRSLGYDVHRPPVATWPEPIDGEGEGEDDMAELAGPPGVRTEVSTPRFITIEASKDSGDVPLPNWLGLKSIVASINGQGDPESGSSRHFGQRAEQRWTRLLNEVISSLGRPVKHIPKETEESAEPDVAIPVLPRDTIVHIQDYRDIQGTREGARVISLLQKVIQERRRAGSRIVLIGSISQELRHTPSQDGSKILQNVFDDAFSKTLVITPSMESKAAEKKFAQDQKQRTMDINIRHLQTMLRFRLNETGSAVKDDIFGDRAWTLDPTTIKQSGIKAKFWSYNQVHWVATLALGSIESGESFGFEHIRRGIELMDKGDQVTNDWLQAKSPKATESSSGQTREQLISSLRKTCTSHEKKLLNGVVDAKSIRTTFNDVQVPPETIDALKTLTSLSLVRPEAFTYGVLATDKIPGLLLYGPPGTGKTLLAKAVARESGATVLEVSGSEVYDMYVGEGEKNVKAIFTLAKKLSPCVVFIDEADAIFCSRTGSSSRTSHRELINQFLREWDGMNDLSAFIMVATNRPFDLDDAVLRRLPRRLLVDLPTETDRHAILKIHLKEEQLDPAVDLADLAKRTELYSGSDLKNLSVAAALACVREENDAAAKHQGDEPYAYPARRILTEAHFERGMEEISASISEDMSSLTAIRKFDEQYGDRRSRRPKSKGWGFGPAADAPTTESVRVRT